MSPGARAEGFLRGRAVVEGLDDDRGSRLENAFQNEWAVAWRARRSSQALAAARDVARPGSACSTACRGEGLRHRDDPGGRRVTVGGDAAPLRCSSRQRPGTRRPARLRLRPRLPLGLREPSDDLLIWVARGGCRSPQRAAETMVCVPALKRTDHEINVGGFLGSRSILRGQMSEMRRIGIDVGGTNTDAVLMSRAELSCMRSRCRRPRT